MTEIVSRLQGTFTGYNSGMIFRLSNGQVWQQARYKYKYKYKYRPRVRVYKDGGRWFLHPDCMSDAIEVKQISVVAEGAVVSDFSGFSGESVFELENGSRWKQDEYKYNYHYAYRPHATVVSGVSGIEIHIEGMGDTVRVSRLR